jgi:hypothetical protein
MSDNKTIKNKMIEKFGDECMIEATGIRYVDQEIRQSMPGYKESDDRIEYHHIKPVKDGGLTTIANGALLKGYNHEWYHKQSQEKQKEINELLQEYKVTMERKKAMEKVKKCDRILAEMRQERNNKKINEMER